MLDFLDLVRLVRVRRIDRQHLLEQARAHAQLVGHGHEVDVERLFTRNQTEARHGGGLYRSYALRVARCAGDGSSKTARIGARSLAYASGSRMVNVAPCPSSLATVIDPLCASMMALAM